MGEMHRARGRVGGELPHTVCHTCPYLHVFSSPAAPGIPFGFSWRPHYIGMTDEIIGHGDRFYLLRVQGCA